MNSHQEILQEIALQLKQISSSISRNDGLFLEQLEELEEFVERHLDETLEPSTLDPALF